MAIKKGSKESPQIFVVTDNPNKLGTTPLKIGDIAINTGLMTLYFCKSTAKGTPALGCVIDSWGTAGTA